MKFNDFPYARIDDQAIFSLFDEAQKNIAKASTPEEIVEITKEVQTTYLTMDTMYTLSYIRNTVDTKDEFYKNEKDFYDTFLPTVSEKYQKINQAILSSPHREALEKIWGDRFFAQMEINVKGISKEILDLMGEESRLENIYMDINAGAIIDWEGKEINLAQLGKYKVDADRSIRRKAFEKEAEFYNKHIDEYDDIYNKLILNRDEQAKKLGYENYTKLGYIRRGRMGYGESEVKAFRDGVATGIVPVVTEIKKKQAQRIGLDSLTFIDDGFSYLDGNPTPVGEPDHLWNQAVKMYSEMSKETKEFIEAIDNHQVIDLVAKEGKRLGGYCTFIPDYEIPFIFSNFNGTSGDVDVLTHEAGHAFNSFANRKDRRFNSLDYTYELAEVHSMAMEFFAEPWYELFFEEDAKRYTKLHFEDSMAFLPYGCMVDEFQHFIYDNPTNTPAQRNEYWLSLEKKYRPHIDFDNLPFYKDGRGWQRQLHIYTAPFYYIDYCLAQTVAFFLYMEMNEDKNKAWEKYMYFINNSHNEFFIELIETTKIDSPFKIESLKKLGEFSKLWLENK